VSPLTRAQEEVVTSLDENLCVTSGAGCGKTSVLVERYIHFLKQDLSLGLERLAAITFTENAAAEMRQRIRQACRRQFTDARQAGDTRRAQTWLRRYWDVDVAPIDTIHGFCGALLRRYPIEAGVDPRFVLLDEAAAAFLAEDVVRRYIEESLKSAETRPNALLSESRLNKAVQSEIRNPKSEINDLLIVFEHFSLPAAREILMEIVREKREVLARVAGPVMVKSDDEILRDLQEQVSERVLLVFRAALESQAIREAARTLGKWSGRSGDTLEEMRAATVEGLNRLQGARNAAQAAGIAERIIKGINARPRSAKAWPSQDAFDAVKAALVAVREALKEATGEVVPFDPETDRRHLALARALFRTAERTIAAYEAAKRDRSALDFEDLQIRARDLLKNEDRIRQECRKRFRAILVDELQDTNLLQFEIVDLLVSGDAARGREPLRPGALFGVGDPKQSIYRFRGAEFEVFQRALDRVGDAGRRELAESFRLHPGTAALVNHLFPPLMGDLYEPVEGRHHQANEIVAEIQYVLATKDQPDGFRSDEGHQAEANRLAARIRRLVQSRAVTVWDDKAGSGPATAKPGGAGRPATYGDIAILFRRMSNLHLYEQALEHAGVPYYVVAGRGFYKQQEVLDAINLLRVLDDPSDDLSLAGVLRSPFFAVSDEGLVHASRMGGSLFHSLRAAADAGTSAEEDRRGLRRAADLLPCWADAKDRMGLAALVDHIIFESGYAAANVGRFGGERAYANLRQMVELARRFQRDGIVSLGDYIDYVTDFMKSEMREEQAPVEVPGSDTVRLMTIHKAKGLEFPVVVIPDMGYVPQGPRVPYYVHPVTGLAVKMRDEDGEGRTSSALALARGDAEAAERAESCRVLYVAITRAKDFLLFASHMGYKSRGSDSWFSTLLAGLGADVKPGVPRRSAAETGEQTICLPDGKRIMLSARPPEGEAAKRGARRVGPRDLFRAGRVSWDEIHERGQRAARRPVAETLAQVRPVALPSRPPLRITATAMATYRRCPALYRWTEVLGIEDPEPSTVPEQTLSPRAWGVASHRAMELARSPDAAAIAAAVDGAIRETAVRPGPQADELRRRLAESVRAFWRGALGQRVAAARQAWREVPFVLSLAGTEIRGTIDLILESAAGQWEVVDYKSSSPAPKAAEAAAAEYGLQLGLYAVALGRRGGRPIDRWSVHFLGSDVTVERPVGPSDAAQIEAAAREVLAGIAAARFDRSDAGACARCRFGRVCNPGSP